jgi:acylphosphatase
METVRFVVEGRVQGVGFRAWSRATARRLGVSGFVRNLPDGSVEILATGTDPTLEALHTSLRTGPPGARVEAVRREPTSALQPTPSFEIRD